MRNLFVSNSKSSIFRTILTILVGGVFLFIPGLSVKTIMIIIGALLLISGVLSILFTNRKRVGVQNGFRSVQGITNVLFGMVFITAPAVMVKIFMIFAGIILLIMGLFQVFGVRRMLNRSVWAWIVFLIGLMTIGGGIFLLSDPYKSAETILPFLGVILILNGISELFKGGKSGRPRATYGGSEVQDISYEEVKNQ